MIYSTITEWLKHFSHAMTLKYMFLIKMFFNSALLYSCDCIGITQAGCEQVLGAGSGKDVELDLVLHPAVSTEYNLAYFPPFCL